VRACVCVCVCPHAERSSHRTLHWPAVSSLCSSSLPPNPSMFLSSICIPFFLFTPYLVLHSTRGTQLTQDTALASGKFLFFFFFFFFFAIEPEPFAFIYFLWQIPFFCFFYSVFGPPLHTRNAARAGCCTGQRYVRPSLLLLLILRIYYLTQHSIYTNYT